MVYDYDLIEVFNKYFDKTSVIHLHGVENDRDHTAVDRLSDTLTSTVLRILKRFTGVVSLEVFSFENLNSSLNFIENHWEEN
jgi:sugar phosphate isomerase/epimerase